MPPLTQHVPSTPETCRQDTHIHTRMQRPAVVRPRVPRFLFCGGAPRSDLRADAGRLHALSPIAAAPQRRAAHQLVGRRRRGRRLRRGGRGRLVLRYRRRPDPDLQRPRGDGPLSGHDVDEAAPGPRWAGVRRGPAGVDHLALRRFLQVLLPSHFSPTFAIDLLSRDGHAHVSFAVLAQTISLVAVRCSRLLAPPWLRRFARSRRHVWGKNDQVVVRPSHGVAAYFCSKRRRSGARGARWGEQHSGQGSGSRSGERYREHKRPDEQFGSLEACVDRFAEQFQKQSDVVKVFGRGRAARWWRDTTGSQDHSRGSRMRDARVSATWSTWSLSSTPKFSPEICSTSFEEQFGALKMRFDRIAEAFQEQLDT